MTDMEISKALAIAIGWEEPLIWTLGGYFYVLADGRPICDGLTWREFDYRNWAVAGPIAERYNTFPRQQWDGSWTANKSSHFADADTPQRAIAMAVIQGAKK